VDVARVLRTVRQQAGLSLRALAAAAGTSHATVAAYEAGRVTPRVDTLARLLAACGTGLQVTGARPPDRHPNRAPPDREFAQALTLVEAVGDRPREAYAPWDAPIFRRLA
jgi:transcriptional regulator with XRE-family HTH domain